MFDRTSEVVIEFTREVLNDQGYRCENELELLLEASFRSTQHGKLHYASLYTIWKSPTLDSTQLSYSFLQVKMAIAGQGPTIVAVMWTETVVALIAIGLRLYTKGFITRNVGFDDYLIIISWVS